MSCLLLSKETYVQFFSWTVHSFPVITLQQLSTLLNQGKKVVVFCYMTVMAISLSEVCVAPVFWIDDYYIFLIWGQVFCKRACAFSQLYLCMPRAPSSLTYCFLCLDTKYVNVVATVGNIAFSIVKCLLSYMALRNKVFHFFYFGSLLNSI